MSIKHSVVMALLVCGAMAAPAFASTTYDYEYVGNTFDDGDNLTGHISVSIFTTIATNIAAPITLPDISSFTITDGTTVITNLNYSPTSAYGSSGVDLTVSGGTVFDWNIVV